VLLPRAMSICRAPEESFRLAGTEDVVPHAHRAISNLKAWLLGTHRGVGADHVSGDLIGSVNLGGKDVIKTKDSSGSFSYLYVRNDVVLGVTTKDDATAAKALAVLP